jgi:hypothetical protein
VDECCKPLHHAAPRGAGAPARARHRGGHGRASRRAAARGGGHTLCMRQGTPAAALAGRSLRTSTPLTWNRPVSVYRLGGMPIQSFGQCVIAPRGKTGARLNAHTELRAKRQRSAREAIYRNWPIDDLSSARLSASIWQTRTPLTLNRRPRLCALHSSPAVL